MPNYSRNDLAALHSLSVICRRASFRLAAAELGVTTSALSHALRGLEERLGVKLLNRTTRSISVTPAGTELLKDLEVGFHHIDAALASLEQLKRRPGGLVRINVPRDACALLVNPVLGRYLHHYPDVQLEVSVDDKLVDIVRAGFDAGIRYGSSVPQDMVAVPLTAPMQWILVASPAYVRAHGAPRTPEDLRDHACIGMRLGNESIYRWQFGRGETACQIAVTGRVLLNETEAVIQAALDRLGIAYCLKARVAHHLESGKLVQLMPEWMPQDEPFVAYYPDRNQVSANLMQLIRMIRADHGLAELKPQLKPRAKSRGAAR